MYLQYHTNGGENNMAERSTLKTEPRTITLDDIRLRLMSINWMDALAFIAVVHLLANPDWLHNLGVVGKLAALWANSYSEMLIIALAVVARAVWRIVRK
jgi:hypothetical protein